MNLLFDILIFAIPLGALTKVEIFPSVSVYLHDVIACLILAVTMFRFLVKREKIHQKKLLVLIGLFLSSGFISLLINSSHLAPQAFIASFAYSIRFAAYSSIIFAAAFLSDTYKKNIDKKLLTAGSLFVAAGLVQYFFYPNLRNLYYLGWDEHLYRLFSTFLDPNFAGAFLVLFLIFITANLLPSINKRPVNIKLGILWLLTLAAVFLTHSRSAFIMLFVGIGTLAVIHKLYKHAVVLIIVFCSLFILVSNSNLEGLNPLRIASVEARIESAREALYIFGKNPIIGVGFNAYRYALVRYNFRENKPTFESHSDAGTDNSFLFVLATTGVVGFLIFLDFWINVLKAAFQNLKKSIYAEIAIASVAAILVDTLFINSIFYAPILAWIFIMVGFMGSRRR